MRVVKKKDASKLILEKSIMKKANLNIIGFFFVLIYYEKLAR
jgi:hypothetical protein